MPNSKKEPAENSLFDEICVTQEKYRSQPYSLRYALRTLRDDGNACVYFSG
ncbi:MAG: hypothetical protein R3C28_25755 [Pirellulaceae bacterium]